MEDKPNYYAIIPANVRYDKELKDKAKLLYGEITALSNKEGKCWAGNSYFANLYGVTNETISRLIGNLIDNGYITSELVYKKGTKEIIGRYLQINQYLLTKKSIPIDKNVKDNNTSNNNTSINKIICEYENEIGLMTPYQLEKLESYLDDISEEMIVEAIHEASSHNAKNLSYIEAILKGWISAGIKTKADIKPIKKEEKKETTSYLQVNGLIDFDSLYEN